MMYLSFKLQHSNWKKWQRRHSRKHVLIRGYICQVLLAGHEVEMIDINFRGCLNLGSHCKIKPHHFSKGGPKKVTSMESTW